MAIVSYRGTLPEQCGLRQERVPAARVSDLLRHIKSSYGPAAYREAKRMLVTVNGKSILLMEVYATPLAEEDKVSFLPICGGG